MYTCLYLKKADSSAFIIILMQSFRLNSSIFFLYFHYSLQLGNRCIVFDQNFRCRVFTWRTCFKVLWVQKRSFWKLVCAYVCACECVRMWLQGVYLVLYICKTNKYRNTKFCTQYHTSALIIFPGFEENRKNGSGEGQTGNETGSENLKNGSNDLLQIR